jgi:hypothetical protein
MSSSSPLLRRRAPLRAALVGIGATIAPILASRATTGQTTAALSIPTGLAVDLAHKDDPAIEHVARRPGGSSRGSTRSEVIKIELVRLLEPGTDAQKVLHRV